MKTGHFIFGAGLLLVMGSVVCAPAQPKSATQTVPLASVSSNAIAFLSQRGKPLYGTLAPLTAADQTALVKAYNERTNLVDRESLIWALAYIGNEEVFPLLKNTMETEFAGRNLTEREKNVMQNIPLALGLLARRSLRAKNYLKQGINPTFWTNCISWKTRDTPDTMGILAGNSIGGLAHCGSSEVPIILAILKTLSLHNEVDPEPGARSLDGALVDAAFHYGMIRDKGMESYDQYYFSPPRDAISPDDPFEKWLRTPEGKEWDKWYCDRHKITEE
jgi:hypothetical protein